jgi:hypothetical protein
LEGLVVTKLTLEEVLRSQTPYLDVFGTETRGRGRPTGSALDYSTSLEVPSAKQVPDRDEARKIRETVKRRAEAVLAAVTGEQLREIYKAELVLELARRKANPEGGRQSPTTARKTSMTVDEARGMPGSGLLPGETYWQWMETFNDKTDEQWAQEKITVKANVARVQRGTSDGS